MRVRGLWWVLGRGGKGEGEWVRDTVGGLGQGERVRVRVRGSGLLLGFGTKGEGEWVGV